MPHAKDQVKPTILRRNSSVSITDARIAGLYDLEHTIGKGHFAVVKLAKHVFTGEKVAVKVIDKTKLDPESAADLMQEVRCMKLVQHPNIVRLYEVIDTHTKLFLILELGDYDMYDYIIKTSEKGIKESDAQQYFSQIAKAIDYCHALHVVHRDLKPENVVFFEKLGMVKLTDFGFSNHYTPGQLLSTSCGSLAYSAPEILLGDAYDAPAIDVWSLGVILYMLVCGRLPFQEANESETLTRILDCRYTIPDHVSQHCKELIQKMLIRDPSKRATLRDVLQSPWVIAGDRGHAEALPLVFKDHLPESAHATIVEQMVAGGIETEDYILNAIEQGEYSYITATYYLLAERVLASCREEQASKLRKISTSTNEDFDHNSGPVLSSMAVRSRSNSWRGTVPARRPCSILKEESEEELSTYLRSSSRQSSRYFNMRKDGSHSSRRSFPSRGSSVESFRGHHKEEERERKRSVDRFEERLRHDSVEAELKPSSANLSANMFSFEELSPIREMMENNNNLITSASFNILPKMEESEEESPLSPRSHKSHRRHHEHLPPIISRTPSAPIPVTLATKLARRHIKPPLCRRNSSPSVSMFGRGLHTSRDRISPQAIQELLELSRYSSMRRAASPDRLDSPLSRSSSPCSSGRVSPAVSTVSGITSRLKVSSINQSTGMRKLSSSPHLLGICEETEDNEEAADSFKDEKDRPIGGASFTVGPDTKTSSGRRSSSTGFATHRWHSTEQKSMTQSSGDLNRKSLSYASLRAIRTKQLHSPDINHSRFDHPKSITRTRRSTSCSSSETSDDDTNERRLNLIAMKYCKRNPEDPKSDDDPPNTGPDRKPRLIHSQSEGRPPAQSPSKETEPESSNQASDLNAKRINLHPIMEHPSGPDNFQDFSDKSDLASDNSSVFESEPPQKMKSQFCRQLRRSCSLGHSKEQSEKAPLC